MSRKIFDLLEQREIESISQSNISLVKDEDASLNERLFREYKSSRENWAKEAKEDDDFRNGSQWTSEQIKDLQARKQAPIVVNVIHPAVEQAKAMLTHNSPSFSCTAKEDSDTKTAKAFADLMSFIWAKSGGDQQLKIAIDDYYVRGLGAVLAYFDPNDDFGKGEVIVKAIDSFDLYIDPNATCKFATDAAHILIAKRMTGEQVQNMIPEAREWLADVKEDSDDYHPTSSKQGVEGQSDMVVDVYHKKYLAIDRYSKVKEGKYHIYAPQHSLEKILSNEEYMQWLESQAVLMITPDGQQQIIVDEMQIQQIVQQAEVLMQQGIQLQPIPMKQLAESGEIMIRQILVNRILRVLTIGDKTVFKMVLPIEDYPLAIFMNRHNRNPYPISDVRFVRGIQQYINKIRSLILAHAAGATNVKLLLPRGATNKKELEREWAKAGTGVIEFDPEIGTPIVAGPIALPSELYKNESDARHDIQEIMGIYALGAGDASQSHDSFKGTIAIDEFGQRRIKSKRDDIEGALNQLAKVVVQMVQAYYQEPKIFRIIQPNSVQKETKLNFPVYDDMGSLAGKMNDVTVGRYDITVVSGSTLPSNRWAILEYYMQLFQVGIIDQVEVLKKTDVADVEGVLERHSIMQQMQQQIMQLQQQLEEVSGDKQTTDRENLHLKQKVEVEKFKTKMTDVHTDIRKAVQVYENNLESDRKIEKEKLKQPKPKSGK